VREIKETPILCDAKFARGLSEKVITQIRIPVHDLMTVRHVDDIQYFTDGILDSNGAYFPYPFGFIGDRIWVREPFRIATVQYKADGQRKPPENVIGGWRGSASMPRWASRMLLEIKNVYIQPLQSMTDNDAADMGSDLFDIVRHWNKNVKDKAKHYATNPMTWVIIVEVI
jgi:hypothetical protein